MTLTNILKIKRNQCCFDGFGIVLITQGWFPKEKEMVKNAFQKNRERTLNFFCLIYLNRSI
jgi:hypothetical protein